MRAGRKMEIIKIDEPGRQEVIVNSYITDRYGAGYAFREPLEPREVGQLYRYFFNQNIPMAISEQDHHYVLIDAQDRVVGGMSYQFQDMQVVQIEGIVVSRTLQSRGVGSAMEEEFCNRMASQGIRVVRGHFLEKFYLSRGYHVNNRWGTLVKFLDPEYP
jgi:predicted GNAT family acetyltransferase